MGMFAKFARVGLVCAGLAIAPTLVAAADNGVVAYQSAYSAEETLKRAEDGLKAAGMKVFGRLDHSAAATEAGLSLPTTVVIVFGNPKTGTPAMTKQPQAAIDFPLKALVYQDSAGKVFFAYNSADYVFGTIFPRHGLQAPVPAQANYTKLLEMVAEGATK